MATRTEAEKDRPVEPFGDLSKYGLLWLINRVVFHPRGYALAIQREDDGSATGWTMLGDGTETWHFDRESDDEEFAKVEAFLASLKPAPAPEKRDPPDTSWTRSAE